MTSTLTRSRTVRTPDLRTSWTPQRNSTKTFALFSKEPPLLSASSFWVCVGGIVYNTHTHTLMPFKEELGLDSQRVKKLASKLHVHSVNFAAKLVHIYQTRPFQYYYQLSPGACFRPSLQPSWSPLIFPSFLRWRSFTILGTFSLINVGSGFHCLRSFFFFLFLYLARNRQWELSSHLRTTNFEWSSTSQSSKAEDKCGPVCVYFSWSQPCCLSVCPPIKTPILGTAPGQML